MSRRVSRGLSLTDKGRAAIGVAETVEVTLLTDAGILARFRPPRSARGDSSQFRLRAGRGSSVPSPPFATMDPATSHLTEAK